MWNGHAPGTLTTGGSFETEKIVESTCRKEGEKKEIEVEGERKQDLIATPAHGCSTLPGGWERGARGVVGNAGQCDKPEDTCKHKHIDFSFGQLLEET